MPYTLPDTLLGAIPPDGPLPDAMPPDTLPPMSIPAVGRLMVNPDEARRVKGMFELYLQHRALIPTAKAINARRRTTKHWTTELAQGGH